MQEMFARENTNRKGLGFMRLKAFHNYVIATIDKPVEIEFGSHGIVVPSVRTTSFPVIGTIVSVGPEVEIPGLKEGIKILYPPYGLGHRITIDNRKLIFLLDYEILGFFNED